MYSLDFLIFFIDKDSDNLFLNPFDKPTSKNENQVTNDMIVTQRPYLSIDK